VATPTEELRRRIVADINAGDPGTKLGSERDLAERYRTSRSSLRQVLAALEEAGLVHRVIGRAGGIFISHAQVQRSVAAGARLLLGGQPLPGPGFYYSPTVLAGAPPGSPAYSEELFGPVASLFRAKDAHEALRLANDSPYGLGASVWTREPDEQRLFIDGLEVGVVFVNALVASDPRLPFGGVKHSGHGRELSRQGLLEFVNTKSVRLAAAPPPAPQPTE